MAELAEEEKIEQEEPKGNGKKSPLKLIIIIVAVIIVGGLLAFGGFYLFKTMNKTETTSAGQELSSDESDEVSENLSEENTQYQNLETFYVNIGSTSEIRYLKITISLELSEKSNVEHLKKMIPRIRDDILILLSSKTIEELSPAKGKVLLKNQIKTRINLILKPLVNVVNVYFTEFIIQ